MNPRPLPACLALLFIWFRSVCAFGDPPAAEGFRIPDLTNTRQLVLVVAINWYATAAGMRLFERTGVDAPWKELPIRTSVMLGRNGLAWGIGLHGQFPPGAAHIKREGDGCTPVGAFALTTVFGYAPAGEARVTRMPYLPLTPSVEGVDDPDSRYYNRVNDSTGLADKDWKSSETMRREDGLYRWGVLVAHNPQGQPGAGSCIFLHIWREVPPQPTSGCTAMPAKRIEDLIRWLDQESHPVLVQLPADEYERLKANWKLP